MEDVWHLLPEETTALIRAGRTHLERESEERVALTKVILQAIAASAGGRLSL